MHAAGHAAQQAFRRVRSLTDKVVHIVPVAQVQCGADLAVKAVFYRHIHHRAALIYHGVQLPAHLLLRAVHTGQNTGIALLRRVQLIAPGGGIDLRPTGAQQRHIPYHDLPRHPQLCRQRAGA